VGASLQGASGEPCKPAFPKVLSKFSDMGGQRARFCALAWQCHRSGSPQVLADAGECEVLLDELVGRRIGRSARLRLARPRKPLPGGCLHRRLPLDEFFSALRRTNVQLKNHSHRRSFDPVAGRVRLLYHVAELQRASGLSNLDWEVRWKRAVRKQPDRLEHLHELPSRPASDCRTGVGRESRMTQKHGRQTYPLGPKEVKCPQRERPAGSLVPCSFQGVWHALDQ